MNQDKATRKQTEEPQDTTSKQARTHAWNDDSQPNPDEKVQEIYNKNTNYNKTIKSMN